MRVRVDFEQVGRERRSWQMEFDGPPNDLLRRILRHIQRRRFSPKITCATLDDNRGVIYAGARKVGTFTCTHLAKPRR